MKKLVEFIIFAFIKAIVAVIIDKKKKKSRSYVIACVSAGR